MSAQLVVLGEVMVSFFSSESGRLRLGQTFRAGVAGAEGNVAVVASRLGTSTAWIGRVGDDALGRLVLDTLAGERVDVRAVTVDPSAHTGAMVKFPRTAGVTTVSYLRHGAAGSRLQPADLPGRGIEEARVLHLSGVTPALSASARDTVDAAIDVARAASTLVSFDVNHRRRLWSEQEASDVLRPLARRADIVFASRSELRLVAADADELLAAGVAEVVVTDGARGALAHAGGGTVHRPAVPVVVVDPVGAGDAFVGGYLSARIGGAEVEDALELGIATGAFAVSTAGDWEGAPTRDELPLLLADDVQR